MLRTIFFSTLFSFPLDHLLLYELIKKLILIWIDGRAVTTILLFRCTHNEIEGKKNILKSCHLMGKNVILFFIFPLVYAFDPHIDMDSQCIFSRNKMILFFYSIACILLSNFIEPIQILQKFMLFLYSRVVFYKIDIPFPFYSPLQWQKHLLMTNSNFEFPTKEHILY